MIQSLTEEKRPKPNFILIQAFLLLLALVLQCSARADLWTWELHGLWVNQKSRKCLNIHLPSPLGPPKQMQRCLKDRSRLTSVNQNNIYKCLLDQGLYLYKKRQLQQNRIWFYSLNMRNTAGSICSIFLFSTALATITWRISFPFYKHLVCVLQKSLTNRRFN